MLYIKFNINNPVKYNDFQKLYEHMVTVRQPDYVFEEEIEPEIDWDNLKEDEVEAAIQKLNDYGDSDKFALKRYQELIPSYASSYIEKYLEHTQEKTTPISESDAVSIMNYLEWDFEVNMDQLEKTESNMAAVKFSTGNLPFGGLDRFIMTLKAYDLVSTECFNGFSIIDFNWINDFEFETKELQEKTKIYLNNPTKN